MSNTSRSSFHGRYVLRRSSTSCQVTSGMPCMFLTRASILCLCTSLGRTHSIIINIASCMHTRLCHMSLASCTPLTASIVADNPHLSCWPASVSATRYAANPVSKLRGRPLLSIADSMGSTEKWGIDSFAARLSATVLLPEPGRPETIISAGLFMLKSTSLQ